MSLLFRTKDYTKRTFEVAAEAAHAAVAAAAAAAAAAQDHP